MTYRDFFNHIRALAETIDSEMMTEMFEEHLDKSISANGDFVSYLDEMSLAIKEERDFSHENIPAFLDNKTFN
jgi:hypothetical protein